MDIYSYKVKNQIILFGFLIGALLLVLQNGIAAAGKGLFSMVILFLILFPIFVMQVLGAADIKLYLLLGFLLGFQQTCGCILVSLAIGAIYSLLKMLYYRNFLERFHYFSEYIRHSYSTIRFQPYHNGQPDKRAVIHFTIPIFISYCIYLIRGGNLWTIF